MTLVIGLTGSIASGKSTVSLMFDELHIPVIDADKIAREVVNPGEESYNKIKETFGDDILREDLTLDRKKLGEIVFGDKEKLELLNGIIHPAIRKRMIEKRDSYKEKDVPCIVLDIPLLYESNLTHFVDKTIVVYVDEDTQLQRLMDRDGFSESEAKARINSQISVKKKAEMADAVVNNNGTKASSYEQLEKILRQWNIL